MAIKSMFSLFIDIVNNYVTYVPVYVVGMSSKLELVSLGDIPTTYLDNLK